jgi:hypothetical protein
LCQRQVSEIGGDLFRRLTPVVQDGNPADGHTGPGNARPTAVEARAARDQATDFGHSRHRLQVYRAARARVALGPSECHTLLNKALR